jgi:hypothetical protein
MSTGTAGAGAHDPAVDTTTPPPAAAVADPVKPAEVDDEEWAAAVASGRVSKGA